MWKSYIKLSSCVNTGVQTSSPKCLTDFPWNLLIVIQNANWTGNCLQYIWNGSSPFEDSNFIQGINAVCPAYSPPRMHTSKTWEEARVRITWVPLHCPFDGSIFQRIIMGALIVCTCSAPISLKIWTFLWILQILLWFHAICISKGCIQICEPLETFNPVLTCASNHPQNILHASPPSPDVLSCIPAACISALLNSTHIMQNIHQTFKNIQLISWEFIQHFIHITPRSWKFMLQKIMQRHMLQYSSAPINLDFLFTTFDV